MNLRVDKLLSREFLLGLIPIIISSVALGTGKIGFSEWAQWNLGFQGLSTGGILLAKRANDAQQKNTKK